MFVAVVNLCNVVLSSAVEVSDLPCSVSSIAVSFVRCLKVPVQFWMFAVFRLSPPNIDHW